MGQTKITKVLADNLKRLRKREKLSQEALANKIGVVKEAVWSWESGRKWPGIDSISLLASALHVSEIELFKSQDESPPLSQVQVLEEFGRLLANAEPKMIRQAIQLLEVGQAKQVEAASPRKNISNK